MVYDAEDAGENRSSSQVSPWLQAGLADFDAVDFDALLQNNRSADVQEISEIFAAECKRIGVTDTSTETHRVYAMLAAISGMHFKPSETNEPFGAMMIWGDRRTAVPDDFRAHAELIGTVAQRTPNLPLKARMADLTWFLERKRGTLAVLAVETYQQIIEGVEKNTLGFRSNHGRGVLQHEARDILLRSLHIGWAAVRSNPAFESIKLLTKRLRIAAISSNDLVPSLWFAELDLSFRISDPQEVGDSLKGLLVSLGSSKDPHITVELWRLTAKAYNAAKLTEQKNYCYHMAAERLVDHAKEKNDEPLLASHFLSEAIAQLHGLPGQKERRSALRHLLIDVQERIPDAMTSFSQNLELENLVQVIESNMKATTLLEKLFIFADLVHSPNPAKLEADAKRTILEHPLSALFGSNHLDREGKVIARTKGSSFSQTPESEAIKHQVSQGELLRRKIVASGQIEPALRIIMIRHQLSDETLLPILRNSPFIPASKLHTYAKGFARLFQGDFISATYILTPLLESSLRHILKANGHDVTIFDDATQTQEDRTISSLFDQMRPQLESVITPQITSDLERVFLTKPGPFIRHSVAHGLLHDGDPFGSDAIYACTLVYRLCLLPLFPYRAQFAAAFAGNEYYSQAQ